MTNGGRRYWDLFTTSVDLYASQGNKNSRVANSFADQAEISRDVVSLSM